MANRLKGEVPVQVGDRTLVFRLGINELIGLQKELGYADDQQFLIDMDTGAVVRGLVRSRAAIKWALVRHQPDTTDEEAGEILTEMGYQRAAAVLGETMSWAMPEPDAATDSKGEKPRPSLGPTPS